jgi:hypothetical protein
MDDGQASRPIVVIIGGDIELVFDVDARRTDLVLVDALARLRLAAQRVGCSMCVPDPSEELRELLDAVGLSGLLLESGWESEGDEESGVEEVVEPGDPPA